MLPFLFYDNDMKWNVLSSILQKAIKNGDEIKLNDCNNTVFYVKYLIYYDYLFLFIILFMLLFLLLS